MTGQVVPYRHIADALALQVRGMRPGERLPSVVQLAREYGAATVTVQRALGVLRDAGLVESVHRSGTYVAEPVERVLVPVSGEVFRGLSERGLARGVSVEVVLDEVLAEHFGRCEGLRRAAGGVVQALGPVSGADGGGCPSGRMGA